MTTNLFSGPPRHELVYGRSGAGKTWWAVALAKALHAETGKRTRWYAAGGGFETAQELGILDIADVCDYEQYDEPLTITRWVSEGRWPIAGKWVLLGAPSNEATDIGLWIYDVGLSGMAEYLMGDKKGGLADRASRGEKLGPDAAIRIEDKEHGTTFGGNGLAQYGYAQEHILGCIRRMRALPGWTLTTSMEVPGEDALGKSIIGPEVAGRKLTGKIGGYFGNTLHLCQAHTSKAVPNPTTGKPVQQIGLERRAYFTEHYDPDGGSLKYYANVRCADSAKLPKAGYFANPDPMVFYTALAAAR